MKKILLAGPWVGELGWELFCWQGHIRWLSKKYDKVIVLCRKGHEFLYSDFTDHFVTFQVAPQLSADMWMCEGIDIDMLVGSVKDQYTEVLLPFNIGVYLDGTGNITTRPGEAYHRQRFIRYKSDTLDKRYDLIFHPRNKRVGDSRNWDRSNWQSLVDLLKDQYSIAVIGNNESFQLDGVADHRNISIEDSVALMNRCRLVVGQSSGPMHLAALAGAKHLVWSHEKNRARFKTIWNPLTTPCIFYGEKDFNPAVDDISIQVQFALNAKNSIWSRIYRKLAG